MTAWLVQPTATRYVRLQHVPSGCEWALQFPESIVAREGQLLDYPAVDVHWEEGRSGAWRYQFEVDEEYATALRQSAAPDPHQARKTFLQGLRVTAEIRPLKTHVELRLELKNVGDIPLHEVVCDGGCLQAKSPQFATTRERERTWTLRQGTAQSLSTIVPETSERCCLHSSPALCDREPWASGEWFWGRIEQTIVEPAAIAMASSDGQLALAIGYKGARTVLANPDAAHHCLHSCPGFGDLAPGESRVRFGRILVDRTPALASDRIHQWAGCRGFAEKCH